LIDEIAIIGTEDEIRERIQEDADGGVHTHIIAPMAASPEDLERTFGAFTADKFELR
jgi:alkanesulfonate monooxygenase SsuD/methylene tetrahydromethanopterin reductase-like flavin-dependent oxidoreductase (luciferase family)